MVIFLRYFSQVSLNSKTIIKALILGVLSSVAVIAVLMCIASLIFTFSGLLPYEYLQYIMLIVVAIGVYFGGYIAARINKSQGLILGVLNSVIVFIALLICGFCISEQSTITLTTLLKFITVFVFSALGGIKGVNVKEKIRIK